MMITGFIRNLKEKLPVMGIVTVLSAVAGCNEETGSGETQFLARRVEALEEKVKQLEARVGGMPLTGSAPAKTSPPLTASAPAAATGLSPLDGATPEEQLENAEKNAVLFIAKAERLQRASRAELPNLIADLGIPASEIDQLRSELTHLEKQKTGSVGNSELEAEIDKLKFRLEIAAEGVRSRVIEEGKQQAARVDSLRKSLGGTGEETEGAETGTSESP